MGDTLVLCYHALSVTWPADLAVRPDAFARQLHALAARGYTGVTFAQAVAGPHDGLRVAVTFDDAYRSVLELARPVLDELGWPGTVFAVTEFAESGRPLAWEGIDHWTGTSHEGELAGLTWAELRGLADADWEVGSHTVTHPHLTRLDDAELDRELGASRAAVEAALGRPCTSIAYPYGDVDERVVAAARRAGYGAGAALPVRWTDPMPLEWPRPGIYVADDLRRFRLKTAPAVRAVRRLLHR